MRAKWRKIIWAILAMQLLVLHPLLLGRAYRLDYLIGKAVGHFHLPYSLYARWRLLVLSGWLATAGIVLLMHYRSYLIFRRACIQQAYMVSEEAVRQSFREAALETGLKKEGTHRKERAFLYRGKGIREPFVIGFRNPVLLLPEQAYSETVLKYIFLHECYHIRHRDTVYKLFWLLVQSLLWFQPLIYLLAALGRRDVEVACDEAVVEGRDMTARKEYGHALLECLRQERERGQAYSAYFYHGKRLMEARLKAILKEERKWDMLAWVGIAVLVLNLGFYLNCAGEMLYGYYQANQPRELVSIYEGYGLPDSFTQSAVSNMAHMEPVPEDLRYRERWGEDLYQEKEYSELPWEAEGPWQVRLKDADYYDQAVGLLLQRYLSYYIDWRWATERNPETHSEFLRLETVYDRLLAGDKQEAVYEKMFRYLVGSREDAAAFPEELARRARFACENGVYYAYFDWTARIRMVQDYVFELEGIADTEPVLAAFREQYGRDVFSDIPVLDLVYEVQMPDRGETVTENGAGTMEEGKVPYQIQEKENTLWVSGGDGVLKEVPVSMTELLTRGDQMDGQLTSLQEGSYQVDGRKQIFAYGGVREVPFSVVYYDEETGEFRKTVVTRDYIGGRRIFVSFPEDAQNGFLILTGERVMWQECSILFCTTDGGVTWEEAGPAGPDWNEESHSLTTDARFIDNQVGFVTIRSSEEPNIWRTHDGGRHWEKQELPDVPENYSMAYAPERQGEVLTLYLGMEEYSQYGGKKAKYQSEDRGETWEYKGFVMRK